MDWLIGKNCGNGLFKEFLLCKYTLRKIIYHLVLREYRDRAVVHHHGDVSNI